MTGTAWPPPHCIYVVAPMVAEHNARVAELRHNTEEIR